MTHPETSAYLDHLAQQGRSANTLAAYGRDLQRYAEFLSKRAIAGPSDVVAADLERFSAWLVEEVGYAQSSASRIIAAVRGLHRWLAGDGSLGAATGLRASGQRATASVLSVANMLDLLDVKGVGDLAVRDRALLELLYATAAKASEVARLRLADIDLSAGVAVLRGSGAREAPLGPSAMAAIGAWLGGPRTRVTSPSDSVTTALTNMAGEPLTRQGIWQVVSARGAAVGLDVSPSVIRASARQHLRDGGMAPSLVRRLFAAGATLDVELHEAWGRAHPRGGVGGVGTGDGSSTPRES